MTRTRDRPAAWRPTAPFSINRSAAPNTTTYANDDLNRVNSINGSGVTYSADQNITGVLGTTQTYDDENNLTSVTAGGATLNLSTDPLGRLFSSTLSGGVKRYLYDGAQLVGEYPSTTSTTLSLRHVPGGSGLDNIALTWTGSGTGTPSYLLTDERGSVIGQSNASGVISINAYDEYGLGAPGNAGTFGYTGQMTLPGSSGLLNYRARTYDPRIGRFLQMDPIGYQGGMNLFAYVGADPVNMVDPWGLDRQFIPTGQESCWQSVTYGAETGNEVSRKYSNCYPIYDVIDFGDNGSGEASFGRYENRGGGYAIAASGRQNPEFGLPNLTRSERCSLIAAAEWFENQADLYSTLGNVYLASAVAAFVIPGVGTGAAAMLETFALGTYGFSGALTLVSMGLLAAAGDPTRLFASGFVWLFRSMSKFGVAKDYWNEFVYDLMEEFVGQIPTREC